MIKLTDEQVKRHKILLYVSLGVILFSAGIADMFISDTAYNVNIDLIRNQIAVIIPCLIISINSCIYLYNNAKKDKE